MNIKKVKKVSRHKILITNDDGIQSPGITALINEFLDSDYDLDIIAPSNERSWKGKSVSSFRKVKHEIMERDGLVLNAIDGTPADCILIGCFHVCDQLPDLVISGINFGANIGNSFILSSATVGAAMEASFLGIKSIAISLLLNPIKKDMSAMKESKANLVIRKDVEEKDFKLAAEIARKVADHILKNPQFPEKTDLININVPIDSNKDSEIHYTSVSRVHYGSVFRKMNEETENYFIFDKFARNGQYQFIEGTDIHSTFIKNSISITPIHLELSGNVEGLRTYFKELF